MDKASILLNLGTEEYQKQTKEGFLKAIDFYTRSAKLGNNQAMCNLGYCYYYGRGIEADKQRGFEYFMDSAIYNNPEGTMKMGDFYRYGEFVHKNEEKALKLYERVMYLAEDLEDYPEIFLRLGECYLKGIGTQKDIDIAKYYLFEAKEAYEFNLDEYFYYQKQLDKVNQLLEECEKV